MNKSLLLSFIISILILCTGCQAIKTYRGNYHVKKAQKHIRKAESINPRSVARDTVTIIKIKTVPALVKGDTAAIERLLSALRDTVIQLEGDRFKTLVTIDYPNYRQSFLDTLIHLPPHILEEVMERFKDVISADIRYVVETQVPDTIIPVDVPVEDTTITDTVFKTVTVEKTPAAICWLIALLVFIIVMGLIAVVMGRKR